MEQRVVHTELLVFNIESHDGVEERPHENGDPQEGIISAARSRVSASDSQSHSIIKVSWLATQIPEFGGTQDESVQQWVRRVDKMALVYGASDGIILLAASSQLTKNAKKWYDIQTGAVIVSWTNLKADLLKIFERKLSFLNESYHFTVRCKKRSQGSSPQQRNRSISTRSINYHFSTN